jgi:hypothetical protein
MLPDTTMRGGALAGWKIADKRHAPYALAASAQTSASATGSETRFEWAPRRARPGVEGSGAISALYADENANRLISVKLREHRRHDHGRIGMLDANRRFRFLPRRRSRKKGEHA